ncbi:MAG: hydrogenase nickel incorporation protein HypB [Armatimonadota bacterium]|nr:hydrogenase nickel incorporation protein HypB [Armatimonadota bacterium]
MVGLLDGPAQELAGADVSLEVLGENDNVAMENRIRLANAGASCINIMSSPGSGKTTLLEHTVARLPKGLHIGVIEGDMTTELDAERLRSHGVPVAAITTGRSCHLEAEMISAALDQLDRDVRLDQLDLVIIENVGNLICPAAYDLGEHSRVVLVATTEGEDKPLKYPIMFQGADCVVITKLDLAPYLKLDVEKLITNIREVNGRAAIMAVSAESGEGMQLWSDWLESQIVSSSRLPAVAA